MLIQKGLTSYHSNIHQFIHRGMVIVSFCVTQFREYFTLTFMLRLFVVQR